MKPHPSRGPAKAPAASLALLFAAALGAGCSTTRHAVAAPGSGSPLPDAAETATPAPARAPAALEAGDPRPAPPATIPFEDPGPPAPTEYPNIDRRFGLSVGAAALQRFDTTLSVSSSQVGAGAILDLEELLNVDQDSTVLRLDAHYAFNPRHRIDLTFYDVERSGRAAVNQDLDVGQVTIPASDVTTGFDTQVIKLAYRYNFVRDERTVIGVGAGLHVMRIDFDIRSSLGAGAQETLAADLPLPVLGLHGEYALSPKWKLYASTELLQVDLGEFGGWIRDTRLGIDHDLFDNFGWGFGFNSFGMNATVQDGPLRGEVDYGFQGFLLYLRTYI